jgi:ribosomal protein L7/L12
MTGVSYELSVKKVPPKDKKISLIKVIRDYFGFGLALSKKIADDFEYFTMQNLTIEEANNLSIKFQQIEAVISIRKTQ